MSVAIGRILHEFDELNKSAIPNLSFETDQANAFKWSACIIGPTGTPFEGGIFDLSIKFPQAYPYEKPDVEFITSIYHPWISIEAGKKGQFCSPKLASWTPGSKLLDIFTELKQVLENSSFEGKDCLALKSTANPEAASLVQGNLAEYRKRAKEWTSKI